MNKMPRATTEEMKHGMATSRDKEISKVFKTKKAAMSRLASKSSAKQR